MIKYLQLPTCKLAEFIDDTDTSFTVSGFLLNDGITPVDPTDIGDICFATLEPKTAREELISFTIGSVTAEGVATITAIRGLLQKSPYGVGGATFSHQSGTDLVISNNPGLFNQLTAKDNDEVITAQWSFPAPSANQSPVTKAYADALVINGGAQATNQTRGVSLLSANPDTTLGVATITIATPGVVSLVAHGLIEGDSIKFTTTGALPTGLVAGNTYYVIAAGLTANTFRLSSTIGGAAINTTGSQSGVHTLIKTTPIVVGYNDTTKLPSLSEKAAMVGDDTPSANNKFVTQNRTMVAGETINGATTPVPVFQNKTDNEFYACDANDATRYKYLGFAVSNGTDGNSMRVQFSGIVSGFTALLEGEKYYVQDAVGTIGNTPGTQEILVGIAISETQLLIQKGTFRKTGWVQFTDNGGAGAVSTSVVTLGFRPSLIRAFGANAFGGGASSSFVAGSWNNGQYNCVFQFNSGSSEANLSGSDIYIDRGAGSEDWRVTITSVTDTGFTFNAVQRGTAPNPVNIIWEAEGQL